MVGQTQGGARVVIARDTGDDDTDSRSATTRLPSNVVHIEQTLAPLIRTIEAEIIPRLLLAHKGAADDVRHPAARGEAPNPHQVLEFAALLLTRDAASAAGYVEAMLDQGFRLEALYLELLTPAARHLGALWEQDLCDFVDVTVALGRIQQVIREFSPLFRDAPDAPSGEPAEPRRILLAPAPGEQHSMGLLMVREFFLRSGWEVAGGPELTAAEVRAEVGREWFHCIGVSVGGEARLVGLPTWIHEIRAASRNPALTVLLGGPHFVKYPELATLLGADATASDAPTAVRQAEILAARFS